jgi:hypothetical protein
MLHGNRGGPNGLTRCSPGYRTFTAKPQPNRRIIDNTMTTPRRRRKVSPLYLVAGLAAAIFGAFVGSRAIEAATTELTVTDHNTGLAIHGFDPVAYFADRAAAPGTDEFECILAGIVWRFRNSGNRAAFLANPDVYMPRFGGYDPVAVARGVAVAGHPQLWLIAGDRLYLFHTAAAREEFAADPERISATADRRWASVQSQLTP